MTLADALASVARLCPADVHATLAAALRRPAGGHTLGRVAVEVQADQRARDARAEDDTRPVSVGRGE